MSIGQQILDAAASDVGERYVLGTLAAMDDAHWHGPWGCAEFASWCLYQAAGTLYGCADNDAEPSRAEAYTGFWARDAKELGKRITVDVAARRPVAAVLRVPIPGHVTGSDAYPRRSATTIVLVGIQTGARRSGDGGENAGDTDQGVA